MKVTQTKESPQGTEGGEGHGGGGGGGGGANSINNVAIKSSAGDNYDNILKSRLKCPSPAFDSATN